MRATVFAYPATLTRDAARRFLVRFPDIPEALTDGASQEEALREAADALSEALMSRIADGEAIPDPSPVDRNQYQVAPDATVAHKAARRLLDPRETSKVPRLTAALTALGYSVTTAVYDAAKRERILSSPGERRTGTLRPRKTVKLKPR